MIVAMVGAGQLARMTHRAAIDLGVGVRVLAAAPDDPAVLAGAPHLLGAPDDLDALRALAGGAEVLTFDHEHVPGGHLTALEAEHVRLAPGAAAKRLGQDKLHARRVLCGAGFPVPPFAAVQDRAGLEAAGAAHGWPLVAKAPTGGYDGRGVFVLSDLRAGEEALARHPGGLLVEPRLEIRRELAVLVSRSRSGETEAYPVAETVQRDGMCRELVVPARVSRSVAAQARDLAIRIARFAGATGVLAVELFETGSGLLVNELALRPHNSGHYTIEGCATSQFEQHLRAVLGLPLGSTALRAPAVSTVNVIGDDAGTDPRDRLGAALRVRGAHVHLYAKAPRPGRKLGHVTVCGDDPAAARAAAQEAVALLGGAA